MVYCRQGAAGISRGIRLWLAIFKCLMDTSAGMIEALTEKIRASGIRNMTPVLHDLAAEAYPGRFDLIYTSMAAHHILDVQGLIHRFYGMLRDGGMLCVVDLDAEDGTFHRAEKDFQGHNGFAHEEMAARFAMAGLEGVRVQTFYHGVKTILGSPVRYSLFQASGKRAQASRRDSAP